MKLQLPVCSVPGLIPALEDTESLGQQELSRFFLLAAGSPESQHGSRTGLLDMAMSRMQTRLPNNHV